MTGLTKKTLLRGLSLFLGASLLGNGSPILAQSIDGIPVYRADQYQPAIQPRTLPGTVRYESRPIASHELVPVRLILERPATREEFVTETGYTTREVTQTRPVWETETRYREIERKVPREIERTITQTQRVEKPVIETAYEERPITETTLKPVTEYVQQRHLVQRPITRTEYRDETVVVEKPVERTVYQTENVTSYRPVTQTQTVYSPALVPFQQPAAPAATTAPSLQWLNRGYVTDPNSNQQIWQRGGLHWVRSAPSANCPPQTAYMQALVPQQQTSTAYVPEVTQQLKPVVVTESARSYETRRIPYSVESTESSVEIRDVPVTSYKPVTETRVERVPVEKLRYETKLITREIPIRETVYDTVRETEPYSVKVFKEVSETTTEQIPHTVKRAVLRNYTERIVRNVYVRVPLDENDERTVSIDPEMTVELDSSSAKIPANDSIVDLDFFRSRTTAAKPSIDDSAELEVDPEKGTTHVISDFSAVPPRPGSETTTVAKEPVAADAEAESGAGMKLDRGIKPSDLNPAAESSPMIKPSDAIGG